MTDYSSKIKNSILSNLDNSIKKTRILEKRKNIPYAVILCNQYAKSLNMDNLIYFSKNGYINIPIIKSEKLKHNKFHLVFSEKELVELINSR